MRRVRDRVPIEECKRRALWAGGNFSRPMPASWFAGAIWPDATFRAEQGAGAAASRILVALRKDGQARWVSDGRTYGWIVDTCTAWREWNLRADAQAVRMRSKLGM